MLASTYQVSQLNKEVAPNTAAASY